MRTRFPTGPAVAFVALCLASACASRKESTAPEPRDSAPAAGAPASAGAMTAAEAAERAHAELERGAGGDTGRPRQTASAGESEEGPCTQDADCTYTRVAAGACCPMLCVPRVVTKKRAAELERLGLTFALDLHAGG